ncbi:MAG: insulinase family protein [Ruminococcaceae bacterium]|nr:insulinase family protein [Oscillospiraceae bacterium]
MTVQTFKVTDSVSLSCIQTDQFKTGILTLTLPLPHDREVILCNSVLPGVLRRGTEQYPNMASLNRRLDDLYASCVEIRSGRIGKNPALMLTAELLDDRYVTDGTSVTDGVIEVLSQMLLHPLLTPCGFDKTAVEQEKRFERDAIRASVNHTRAYAAIRLSELMHREDRTVLTLREREAGLAEITPRGLADFYRTAVRSAPIYAFYVGSLPPRQVADLLSHRFGEWKANDSVLLEPPTADPGCGFCSVSEPMSVSQGKLAMGFRTGSVLAQGSKAASVATVFNELLGGSPASKLFLNVREKMGLCYYCSSSYSPYTGILTVFSGIETAKRQQAEEAILAQLEELRQGKISDTEFHAARVSLENAYRQIYDNPADLQSFYEGRRLFGISDTVEELRRTIASVTQEEVIHLAKQVTLDAVFFVEGTLPSAEQEDESDE